MAHTKLSVSGLYNKQTKPLQINYFISFQFGFNIFSTEKRPNVIRPDRRKSEFTVQIFRVPPNIWSPEQDSSRWCLKIGAALTQLWWLFLQAKLKTPHSVILLNLLSYLFFCLAKHYIIQSVNSWHFLCFTQIWHYLFYLYVDLFFYWVCGLNQCTRASQTWWFLNIGKI